MTSENLYKSLELVVDKKTLPDKVTLQQILESWVTQPGYPVISVTKDKQEKKVTIEQKQFYLVEPIKKETKWYIPLNYVQQEKGNFDDTSVMLWLTPDKKSIEITNNIEKESWIIFNVQQTGEYNTKSNCVNISFLFDIIILLYVYFFMSSYLLRILSRQLR